MKRRKLTIGLGIAVAVLVLLLLFLQFFLGHTIKLAVNKAGPAILKTDVRIENVHARILSGKLKIDGILIGAPEGFDANVFEMNNLTVDIDVPSLFSDTIHIREVTILDPIVTYELKGLNSNLSALLAPFEKKDGEEEKEVKEEKPAEKEPAEEKEVKEEEPAEKEPAEKKPAKKLMIDKILFQGGKVRMAVASGKGAVLPLPNIELADIGKKSGGSTGVEVAYEVLKSITSGTLSAVAGVVGDVGGLTVDGVKAVTGAAAEGVSKEVKAITGLFGGGSSEEEPAAAEEAKADAKAAAGEAGAAAEEAAGSISEGMKAITGLFGGGKKDAE